MECKDCDIDFNANPSKPRNTNAGLIVAAVAGGSAFLLSAICLPFVTPALRRICLPYVPATTNQVSNVLKALEGRQGSLVDLGSGDGRIVHEAAKVGFKSVGVELNPWLVLYSRLKSISLGISSSTKFYRQDMWKVSLKPYNNVVIFGVDCMMEELEKKCQVEMAHGSVVAACRFPFPTLPFERTIGEGIDSVWVYSVNDPNSPSTTAAAVAPHLLQNSLRNGHGNLSPSSSP